MKKRTPLISSAFLLIHLLASPCLKAMPHYGEKDTCGGKGEQAYTQVSLEEMTEEVGKTLSSDEFPKIILIDQPQYQGHLLHSSSDLEMACELLGYGAAHVPSVKYVKRGLFKGVTMAIIYQTGLVKTSSNRRKYISQLGCYPQSSHQQLNKQKNILNRRDQIGDTPLLKLIKSKASLDEIKSLVQKGADINLADTTSGMTPLMHAISQKNIPYIQFLLEAKASVNILNNSTQWHALDYALNSPLDTQIIQMLIEAGSNVNQKLQSYPGLLSWSVTMDKGKNFAQYLVDQGADVNQGAPLHTAASKGNVELVKYLLDKKAHPNHLNASQRSALHMAIGPQYSQEIIKELIEHGADVNQVDSQRTTPLLSAVESGNASLVEFLLENGAKWNVVSPKLMADRLSSAKNFHLIPLLLKNGFPSNATTSQGNPLLNNVISHGGDQELIKEFLAFGADVTVSTHNNPSAFNWAVQLGMIPLIKLFLEKKMDAQMIRIAMTMTNNQNVKELLEKAAQERLDTPQSSTKDPGPQ